MPTGTVKFYIADRGYGFITPDDGQVDDFFHVSQLVDTSYGPRQGDRVLFDRGTDSRSGKARAVMVRRAESP
jgi:CspA family cold shock protein